MHSIKLVSAFLLITWVFSAIPMELLPEPALEANFDDYMLAHQEYVETLKDQDSEETTALTHAGALLDISPAFNHRDLPESLKNFDLSKFTRAALPTWEYAASHPDWYIVKGRLKCPVAECKNIAENSTQLLNHLEYLHQRKTHFCKKCSRVCTSASGLKQHMQKVHVNKLHLFKCPQSAKLSLQ